MDYRDTLNLPHTEFPMRAGLPDQEPLRLAAWQRDDLYGQLRLARRGRRSWVLHDGPPYANGDIHMGTALNKILKDIINRYHALEGDDVVYVPGYDTHGLPIEMRALNELGVSQHQIDPVTLRAACQESATRFMGIMNGQFQRLGVMGAWNNAYATLQPRFEAAELRLFGQLVDRGLVYKDKKAVYWCPTCETALAEAELEYHEVTSPSIWVAFPIVQDAGRRLPSGTQAVIWTTTPWTIPSNVAIAYNPVIAYVVLETNRGRFLVADALAATFLADIGATEVRPSRRLHLNGSDLERVVARHPYLPQDAPLVAANHVTTEAGTGLVHTAPGHGLEDFEVGRRFGLPVVQPLDDQGRFAAETPVVGGLRYGEANPVVIQHLDASGALLLSRPLQHQYAHCWRCKQAVIFRATPQWFLRIEPIRDQLLTAAAGVEWVPGWGRERMRQMVADRQDWCLSRQRSWGLPIPALTCTACEEPVLLTSFIEHLAALVEEHGAGIWWEWTMDALLPLGGLRCPHCRGTDFAREYNIFDVWLDSGATQAAVLAARADLSWPADMVLEGGDQFRGWFNSLLTTAVATRGQAPYRQVVTHGWVLDGEGRPMHKSLGNVLDPFRLVEKQGADIVRLWVAASDFRADVRVSPAHLQQMADTYRKWRNTFRFLLGNLHDFRPEDALAVGQLDALDRWALCRLDGMLNDVREAYAASEFHVVVTRLSQFAILDLSNFYLDVVKDRLYTLRPSDLKRRSTQTVLWHTLEALVRIAAPILPFTAEEVWGYLPPLAGRPPSVVLSEWPNLPPEASSWGPGAVVERLRPLREAALPALEGARRAKIIGNSLEAALRGSVPAPMLEDIRAEDELTLALLMVAEVHLVEGPSVSVAAERSSFAKCERCWRHVARRSAEGICARCEAALSLR